MSFIHVSANCSGTKVHAVNDQGKEICRAYLYLIYNDRHQAPVGLLEDVFVDEQFRHEGLGTSLIQEIIALAKSQGCYKLIATSRHSRPEVHQFYQKLGFVDHGLEFRMEFK